MLGNKLNKQHIVKACHNTRNFLGNAYSHGKHSLGTIDDGIKFQNMLIVLFLQFLFRSS